MRDGSNKIILAAAALVGVWVVTYWLWPESERAPAITYDDLPEQLVTPASETEPEPTTPSRTDATPEGPDPSTNPIGAELEPAPQPDFPAVIPPEFDEHLVAEGETIWSIAESRWGDRNLGGVIARANPTIDPKSLRPGTRLLIPKDPRNIQGTPVGEDPAPPKPEITEYVVEENDTLGAISRQFYGTSQLWTRIRDANPGVVGPNGEVRVGAKLLIPPPPARNEES